MCVSVLVCVCVSMCVHVCMPCTISFVVYLNVRVFGNVLD